MITYNYSAKFLYCFFAGAFVLFFLLASKGKPYSYNYIVELDRKVFDGRKLYKIKREGHSNDFRTEFEIECPVEMSIGDRVIFNKDSKNALVKKNNDDDTKTFYCEFLGGI